MADAIVTVDDSFCNVAFLFPAIVRCRNRHA
jgi:hypothetical protein